MLHQVGLGVRGGGASILVVAKERATRPEWAGGMEECTKGPT